MIEALHEAVDSQAVSETFMGYARSRDMSLHARRLQIIMQGMALRLILQQFLFQTELRAIQEISQNFFQMIM